MEKIKLLLYCCKQPHKLFNTDKGFVLSDFELGDAFKDKTLLNGKIVAECDFEVDTIVMQKGADDKIYGNNGFMGYGIISKNHSFSWYDENKTCLSKEELFKYLKGKNGYAIHIKNLNIFDEPKELSECMSIKTFENDFVRKTLSPEMVSKAPQNMMKVKMWVDGKEFGMWKNYVLISIRPEWLVKILNGEKTIEVRKKVLKEMVK